MGLFFDSKIKTPISSAKKNLKLNLKRQVAEEAGVGGDSSRNEILRIARGGV